MMPPIVRVFRTIQTVAHKLVMSEPNSGSTASIESIPLMLLGLLKVDAVDDSE